jgi:glycosyltransferase involved in cell wall biosynthesis
MCVIPNGIDSDRFAPRSFSRAGDFVAAFSGNLSRRKGADLLPRIAQQLRPGQRIVCIGLRPSALPAAGTRLEFRQSLPNELMPDFYNSCDALLMPTVREGMSLAALEAMGCGLPIVATDCPSMREIVEDGKGGLLCPIGDAGAFTERLQWLADNPLARSAMGQFNRLRVRERHDYRLMASRYQQLFKGLHASAPTASGA